MRFVMPIKITKNNPNLSKLLLSWTYSFGYETKSGDNYDFYLLFKMISIYFTQLESEWIKLGSVSGPGPHWACQQ